MSESVLLPYLPETHEYHHRHAHHTYTHTHTHHTHTHTHHTHTHTHGMARAHTHTTSRLPGTLVVSARTFILAFMLISTHASTTQTHPLAFTQNIHCSRLCSHSSYAPTHSHSHSQSYSQSHAATIHGYSLTSMLTFILSSTQSLSHSLNAGAAHI